MSSFKIRRLPVARTHEATDEAPDEAPVEEHPRGRGFGVLSRIARVGTDEVADYAPRHRRDVPADAEPSVPDAD